MYQNEPTWPMFLAAYATGFPFDAVQAVATAAFLLLLSRPLLRRLDRLRLRYGFLDS